MNATEYKFTVDGEGIGSIAYPFPVNLKESVLDRIRYEVAEHYGVLFRSVDVKKLDVEARRDSMTWGTYYELEHRGKIA